MKHGHGHSPQHGWPSCHRGYAVVSGGNTYYVLHTQAFDWCICHGQKLDFVPTSDGRCAIGFRRADDAIEALIGASR